MIGTGMGVDTDVTGVGVDVDMGVDHTWTEQVRESESRGEGGEV